MKWIVAIDSGDSPSGLTRVWEIVQDPDRAIRLGFVKWHGPWRKYAFFPRADTLFEADCLVDLATFCRDRTADHRSKRSA